MARGRPGDDAVEVFGVALRRSQCLSSPGRAPGEVRERRRVAIEPVDHRLGGDRGLVNGAMREIHEDVFVDERVARRSRVTGVGARGGVARAERVGHRRVTDRSREPAVADHLQLAVPTARRHPDFRLDVRARCGRERDSHATERSERGKRVGATRPTRSTRWRREPARRNRLRERDRSVLHRERGQALTCGRGRCGRQGCDRNNRNEKPHSCQSHAANLN